MTEEPGNRSRKSLLRPLMVVVVAGAVLWWSQWDQQHTVDAVQDQIDTSLMKSADALLFTDELVQTAFRQGVQQLRGHDVMAPLRLVDVHREESGEDVYTARLLAGDGDFIGLIIQYTGDGKAIIAGVDLQPQESP